MGFFRVRSAASVIATALLPDRPAMLVKRLLASFTPRRPVGSGLFYGPVLLPLLLLVACRGALNQTAPEPATYRPALLSSSSSPAPRLLTVAMSDTAPNGPAVHLNPGMSTQALQEELTRAPRGANVIFASGTYQISSQITIPCSNLHLSGPVAKTPTAVLSALYNNSNIFNFDGECDQLGSMSYLHFENTGAVHFNAGNDSNFRFEHNLVTSLPSEKDNITSESGLYFDGNLNTRLSNVLVRNNTFGDDKSCTAAFATVKDEGGYCAGVLTSQGVVDNLTIDYNTFYHVEQGVHFFQLAQFKIGTRGGACVRCKVNYNYIYNYHRIGIESQVSTPIDGIQVEHNAIIDPINSSWGTYAVSMACCQWGDVTGTPGASPGYVFNDNVLIASLPIGSMCPPYGVEFWGTGVRGTNSLIQGKFCHGYTWGFGAGAWEIRHNYICGPDFVAKGGYISNQQKQNNPPEQSDNLTAPQCHATASTTPTIVPAGGAVTTGQKVTLQDAGLNTGIWYTTDGSDPVPGSGSARYYTAPFPLTGAVTIKAVGMWGAAHQPVKYPQGYGYIPSAVVAASFTNSAGTAR